VTVSPGGEDRAYRIMRNAIARAPYYARQVSEFEAEIYLKGSFNVVKISRLARSLAGESLEDINEGDNITRESWNVVTFTSPDKYEQRVIKQIDNTALVQDKELMETRAMKLVNINIYDTDRMIGDLIISPLSSGAFSHYRFRYEGYSEDRGRIVNRIRIIPRRKSQQLVAGHIFIVEDLWNVHGLDITGKMNIVANIDFRLQTGYGEVAQNLWMPTGHRITFDLGLIGTKATMNYVASVDYTRVKVNEAIHIPGPESADASGRGSDSTFRVAAAPLPSTNRGSYRAARRAERRIEAPARQSLDVTKEFTENYTVTFDSLALEPDPGFWDRVRPVELEPAELKGYRERMVVATEKTPPPPPDSAVVKKRRRKTVAAKFIFGGANLRLGKSGGEILWHGVIPEKSGFNTVDGFYFGIAPIDYRKTFSPSAGSSGGTNLVIRPQGGWAIDRRTPLADLMARLEFAPMRRGEIELRAGTLSRNFSSAPGDGILPFDNTVASLVFRRNYLKLYGDTFAEAAGSIDLANGLALSLSAKYSLRRGLTNSSDYSFFYRKERVYTDNIVIEDHTAAIATLGIEYTPHQYYRVTAEGRKVPVRSDWPTFFVGWKKGIRGIRGSTADFDHISGGIRQNIDMGGTFHTLKYFIYGGAFVTARSLHFPDFRHFDTADLPVTNSSITSVGSYRMLGSYIHSTDRSYLELHVAYQARFLLIKLLPWFSGRLWTEGVQLHYLDTPGLRNHVEIDYTVGLLWKAGLFVGFDQFKYNRIGFKFSIPIKITRHGLSFSM
jgi:hypothetical protein